MDQLRKDVIKMQLKIKDMLDAPNDSAASRLKNEVQGLEDDLQTKKNARTIEDRVVRIINLLNGDARRTPIMNIEHLQSLEQWFEGVRARLRRLQ